MFPFLKYLIGVFLAASIVAGTTHAQGAFSLKKWPLDLGLSSRTATFSGELDTTKYSEEERKQFRLSLYYVAVDVEAGTTPFTSAVYDSVAAYNQDPDRPEGKKDYRYVQASKLDLTPMIIANEIFVIPQESLGVDEKTGKYTFVVRNLSPGTTYYYAQVAEFDGKVEVRANQFDSAKGHLSVAEREDDFEKRSYRLLSPFPGLAVLLDPDLCLQLLNEGKPVPSLCTREDPSGFNTFLNYMFKLLIGLSAALLVLRMIFEGYQYVVTDVPFLKANAKSKLFEAFFGLLLALSAYLILNTINPKLVSNKIEISQIDITVDEVEDYNYTEADYKSLMQQGQQYGITNYKCPDAQVISGGGVVNDGRIKNKVCSVLENGALKPKGIVIHGTAGTNNSDSILRGWTTNNILWDKGVRSVTIKGKSLPIAPSSTHFIVDKDGTISQAVRLNKTTNHCAKCTKSGSTNSTSISIEVVMACIKDCGTPRSAKKSVWEQPTSAQVQSTTYLVNYLLKEFALNKNTDIYVHGEEASNRTYNEGRNTLDAIRSYLR